MGLAILILLALIFLFVLTVLAKTIRIVPQARAGIVERFGKYRTTLDPGLNVVVPFIDKVRYVIDMREQVVSFPPQPVITEDNLVVSIDTVIYFQVTDPVAATYEIANYIQAIEQLTMTTLRNIVGGMDLEETLTSRESINGGLRGVLDEATGKWGVRVNRVELKGIDPPPSIKDSMEKQMRADRDKRAAILTAEGDRQSAILTAEGNKQSAILNAEGERESSILRAQADREAMFDFFQPIGRNPYLKKQLDGSLRHESELAGDRAIEFINQQKGDAPFCLSISFNAAHAEDGDKRPGIGHFPWPKAVDGMYEDVEINAPRLSDPNIFQSHPQFMKDSMNRIRYFWRWDTPEKNATNLRANHRMISGIDNVMNRVIQHLDKVGVADKHHHHLLRRQRLLRGPARFRRKMVALRGVAACAADYLRSARRKKTTRQSGRPNGAQHRHRTDHS